MTALVRPPCTTSVTDGLCVFPYFAAPHSIIRYQRVKCSSTIPRARATCTAHIYSTYRFIDLSYFVLSAWQHQSPRFLLLSTSGRRIIYRDGWNPSHPRRGPIAPLTASGGHWPRHAPTRIGKPFWISLPSVLPLRYNAFTLDPLFHITMPDA